MPPFPCTAVCARPLSVVRASLEQRSFLPVVKNNRLRKNVIYDPTLCLSLPRWLKKTCTRVCAHLKRPICICHFLASLPDFLLSPLFSLVRFMRSHGKLATSLLTIVRGRFFTAARGSSQRVLPGVRIKRQSLDRNRPYMGRGPRCACQVRALQTGTGQPGARTYATRPAGPRERGARFAFVLFLVFPPYLSPLSWLHSLTRS